MERKLYRERQKLEGNNFSLGMNSSAFFLSSALHSPAASPLLSSEQFARKRGEGRGGAVKLKAGPGKCSTITNMLGGNWENGAGSGVGGVPE